MSNTSDYKIVVFNKAEDTGIFDEKLFMVIPSDWKLKRNYWSNKAATNGDYVSIADEFDSIQLSCLNEYQISVLADARVGDWCWLFYGKESNMDLISMASEIKSRITAKHEIVYYVDGIRIK